MSLVLGWSCSPGESGGAPLDLLSSGEIVPFEQFDRFCIF